MWWILGAFLFFFVLCRVMLASKSIDRFFASQNAETDSGAQSKLPRRDDIGRVVPFIRHGQKK